MSELPDIADAKELDAFRWAQKANAEQHDARIKAMMDAHRIESAPWHAEYVCDTCGGQVIADAGIWRHEDPAERLLLAASKLDVKSGDTLVFTTPAEISQDQMRSVIGHYRETGKDITVLALPADMTVETLDEDEMRRAGWVRAPRAADQT